MPATATPPPPTAAPKAAPPAPAKPEAASRPDPNDSASPLYNPVLDEHFKTYDKPKETKPAPTAPAKTETAPAAKPEAKAEPKKPEEKAEPVKEEAKPDAKATEAKAEEFKTNKDLRNAYESTKAKEKQLEAKLKEFEAKLAQAEKTGTATDEKVWQERIEAKQKELQALQTKLAQTDFTHSEEYQSKFYQPYVNTWKRALTAVMAIKSTGVDGSVKTLSKEDAEHLLSLPDSKMAELSQQMFGNDIAAIALLVAHKNRISEAFDNLNEGKAQFEKLAAERRQEQERKAKEEGDYISSLWVDGNKKFRESSPWFNPDENDPEGNELLTKGYDEANEAWSDGTPQQRVERHIKITNRAAAYPRLVHTVEKLKAQLEAITKERDELMASAPAGGDPKVEQPTDDADKSMNEKIDEFFKKK